MVSGVVVNGEWCGGAFGNIEYWGIKKKGNSPYINQYNFLLLARFSFIK